MALCACQKTGGTADTTSTADTISADNDYSFTLCGTASSGDACLAFSYGWHKGDGIAVATEPAGAMAKISVECPISRSDSDFKQVKACSLTFKNKASGKKVELEGDPAAVNALAASAPGQEKTVIFKAEVEKAVADSVLDGPCYVTVILN